MEYTIKEFKELFREKGVRDSLDFYNTIIKKIEKESKNKVFKVISLDSETEGEFDLVHIISSLLTEDFIWEKIDNCPTGEEAILSKGIYCFLNLAYILDTSEPGMTSLDIFLVEEN